MNLANSTFKIAAVLLNVGFKNLSWSEAIDENYLAQASMIAVVLARLQTALKKLSCIFIDFQSNILDAKYGI